MGTTGTKKNLRGATTYAPLATDKYRDNYDRIFRNFAVVERCQPGEHDFSTAAVDPATDELIIVYRCRRCNAHRTTV